MHQSHQIFHLKSNHCAPVCSTRIPLLRIMMEEVGENESSGFTNHLHVAQQSHEDGANRIGLNNWNCSHLQSKNITKNVIFSSLKMCNMNHRRFYKYYWLRKKQVINRFALFHDITIKAILISISIHTHFISIAFLLTWYNLPSLPEVQPQTKIMRIMHHLTSLSILAFLGSFYKWNLSN